VFNSTFRHIIVNFPKHFTWGNPQHHFEVHSTQVDEVILFGHTLNASILIDFYFIYLSFILPGDVPLRYWNLFHKGALGAKKIYKLHRNKQNKADLQYM